MSIYQRNGYWQVVASYKGQRQCATAPSEVEAKQEEERLIEDMKRAEAEAGKAKAWTLEHAFDRCHKACWLGKPSETKRIHQIKCAKKFFGFRTTLDLITTSRVAEWVDDLTTQGKSGGTVNRYLAALSKVFTYAHAMGGCTAKPSFGISRKQESEGRHRFLSWDEEDAMLGLFAQWDKPDHRDLTSFLVDTGMRLGEALRVQAEHCDLERKLVTIWKSKNRMARSVPMTPRVEALLHRRLKDTPKGLLWPHTQRWYDYQWNKAKAALGLGDDGAFVPHCLRHTCASRLVQAGTAIQVVKEWLGHKTITVTLRYAHLCPTNLVAAVGALVRPEKLA